MITYTLFYTQFRHTSTPQVAPLLPPSPPSSLRQWPLVSCLIASYVGASDIGHDIWQDILVIIPKRHNSLNASCQCEYRQTVKYVSTDRLILDLTHKGRFGKNLELCRILDSCVENPVHYQAEDLSNPTDTTRGICTHIPDPTDLEYIRTLF